MKLEDEKVRAEVIEELKKALSDHGIEISKHEEFECFGRKIVKKVVYENSDGGRHTDFDSAYRHEAILAISRTMDGRVNIDVGSFFGYLDKLKEEILAYYGIDTGEK